MIVTLAGRRTDALNTEDSRFPLSNIAQVKNQLLDFFTFIHASVLVCSGSAGADLLALEAAAELNMESYMILPYNREEFLATSVKDRNVIWTEKFNRIADTLQKTGHLIILNFKKGEPGVYEETNTGILNFTEKLVQNVKMKNANQDVSEPDIVWAVIVWEGKPKVNKDVTFHFKKEAEKKKFKIKEINTLP